MDALLGQGQEEGGGRLRRQLDHYGKLITIVVGKYLELNEGGPNPPGLHGLLQGGKAGESL